MERIGCDAPRDAIPINNINLISPFTTVHFHYSQLPKPFVSMTFDSFTKDKPLFFLSFFFIKEKR